MPLRDVFAEIEEGANQGRKATGKSLTEHFGARRTAGTSRSSGCSSPR